MITKISAVLLTLTTLYILYSTFVSMPELFIFCLLFGLITVLSVDIYKYFLNMIEKIKSGHEKRKLDNGQQEGQV